MLIRQFKDEDIDIAFKLAKLTWGSFYSNQNDILQNFIYEFTLRYYDRNRNYSFSAIENNELKAFLLALRKSDYFKNKEQFEKKAETLPEGENTARELFEFVIMCGAETKNFMTDSDIQIGLFASSQKGCGHLLLEKLYETCKAQEIKNVYLWTDTTCNCEYYKNHNFLLQKTIETTLNNKPIGIMIYKKKLTDRI